MRPLRFILLAFLLTISSGYTFAAETPGVEKLRHDAEQGLVEAQYNLGMAYREGEGVPRDYATAYMWMNLAAAQSAMAKKGRDVLEESATLDPGPATASETQCDDVAVWQDWEHRTAEHPDDMALHTLHALWMGLCVKVSRHDFTIDQADEVFEYVRRSFIERRREYNTEKEDKPKM